MSELQSLRERIMRRVWGIYVVRQLTSPALRILALGGIVLGLDSAVSIKNVIENALSVSGPLGLARFSLSAVLNTSVLVQILLVLAFSFCVWFIIDAVRTALFVKQMRAAL